MKNILTTMAMLILCVNILFAGVKLEFKSYEIDNENESESNIAIFTSDKLRIEGRNQEGNTVIIYDSNKDKIWMLNKSEKQYTVISKEMLLNMKKQVENMMDQMKQQFANLPDAQREQIEKMMGAQMGGVSVNYTLSNTKKTENINNWNTTKYILKADDEIQSEIWATTYSTLGVDAKDFEVMNKFSAFSSDMLSSMPKIQKDPFSAIYDEMKGIPVKTINMSNDSVNELVNVSKYNASDEDFAVPSDYKEQKLSMPGNNR